MSKLIKNTQIYYKNLVDDVIDYIVSLCVNIKSSKLSYPDDEELNRKTISLYSWDTYYQSEKRSVGLSAVIDVQLITNTVNIADTSISYITKENVINQLKKYLTESGIYISDNIGRIIYGKGIMYFYNCVAIFLSAHLRRICNKDCTQSVMLYESDINYIDRGISDEDEDDHSITKSILKLSYGALLSAWSDVHYNDNQSDHLKIGTYSCSSSSSSSCSSSSCSCSSSSSSSSSSSTYIVYMMIS